MAVVGEINDPRNTSTGEKQPSSSSSSSTRHHKWQVVIAVQVRRTLMWDVTTSSSPLAHAATNAWCSSGVHARSRRERLWLSTRGKVAQRLRREMHA